MMYCCTRDHFFRLDKMREKVCDLLRKKFLPILGKYKDQIDAVPQDQKQLYLHARIMHITLLLCEERKKNKKEK